MTNLANRLERLTTRILGASFPDGLEWTDDPSGLEIQWVQCGRCGSGVEIVDCWDCGGDGYSYHDCGEDCCVCLYPEPNVVCDTCGGERSFGHCISTPKWCEAHPLPGRSHVCSTAMSGEAWGDYA